MGVVVLIAKGWHYVRTILTREDITGLTIIMGVTYISYSSLFVTANIASVDMVMDIWMNAFYLGIIVYTFKCCWQTKNQVLA